MQKSVPFMNSGLYSCMGERRRERQSVREREQLRCSSSCLACVSQKNIAAGLKDFVSHLRGRLGDTRTC